MVRVHRDKVFRALDMLAEGRTVREVAKDVSLSFTQLRELREVLPLYVEVRELEERLRSIREDYLSKLREVEELEEVRKALLNEVNALKRERYKLQREIEALRSEKERLNNEIRRVLDEGERSLREGVLGILNRLVEVKEVIDQCLKMSEDIIKAGWLIHETYTPYRKVVRIRDKVLAVEYVKPGYTCVRDDAMEVFNKLSRTLKDLRNALKAMDRELEEVINRVKAKLHRSSRVASGVAWEHLRL